MTLPTPSSQSSAQPSDLHRDAPDCPAIVTQSMPVAREGDQQHDDKQWTDIVLAGLSERSPKAREALLEALLNDVPARSTGSSKGIEEGSSIGGEGASGYAGADDRAQASADTSPVKTSAPNHGDRSGDTEISASTVPPILPLRSNKGGKASGKDRLNGAAPHDPVGCTTNETHHKEGSMPLLAPFSVQR